MSESPHRRFGAAYANEVGPDHVGHRVTIRYLVDDDGTERPTDVVGRLLSWDVDGMVVVQRRDGTPTRLPAAAIVASRLVPEPPPRRRG